MVWLLVIALFVLFGLLIYLLNLYNSCAKLRNSGEERWSVFTEVLNRRSDELPKLIELSKDMQSSESIIVEKLLAIDRRFQESLAQHKSCDMGEVDQLFCVALKSFFDKADQYPLLRVDKSYKKMKTIFRDLQKEIDQKREDFNQSVEVYNTEIKRFPSSLVCKAFRLGTLDAF